MIFYKNDGTPSRYPANPEDAKKLRILKYDDGIVCKSCRSCSIKYARSGRCAHCATLSALHFSNIAHGHARLVAIGEDYHMQTGDMLEPVPDAVGRAIREAETLAGPRPAVAPGSGQGVYVRASPCARAGHVGLVTDGGACVLCRAEPKRAPAAAKKRGPGRPAGSGPAAAIMAAAPDWVVSRGAARAMGSPVYRTGRPCRKGHTGYRYVSTGACVECLRGR